MKHIGTKTTIKMLLKKHNMSIKKKFGQNFLVDQNMLHKIVKTAEINEKTLVIEIGPGFGSLTEHLVPKAKHVLAFEIDEDVIPHLKETFKEESITLLHKDILEVDLDEEINSLDIEFDSVYVVSNLPYYITTPIVMKVIEESEYVDKMVLMMQYEVAKRITSSPSTKDYNSLSIAIQYKTNAAFAFSIPKTVFFPQPNVDSAIVVLDVLRTLKEVPDNEKLFYSVVRKSFSQRRKTLVNNLYKQFSIPKDIGKDMLIKLNLNPKIRAERLTLHDFIMLSNRINDYQKTNSTR